MVLLAVAGAIPGATVGEILWMPILAASYVTSKVVDDDELCNAKYRPDAFEL